MLEIFLPNLFPLYFTVDDTKPSAPSSVQISASITNDITTLSITGTAEAGSTVNLLNGITVIGTVNADVNSGDFTIVPSTALDEGDYNLTVTATDQAGNTSDPSTGLAITIDTTSPAQP